MYEIFVLRMLMLCGVKKVTSIKASDITETHFALMQKCMKDSLKELISRLSAEADEFRKTVKVLATETPFVEGRVGEITSEEANLISCIYLAREDRVVLIIKKHIRVGPSRKVLFETRRQELDKEGVL